MRITNLKTCLTILVLLLATLCITAIGETIYVDKYATGANDGSSRIDAYNFLQDALADANSAEKPVEIWVAEGIYTPDSNSTVPDGTGKCEATFELINGVSIYGGFQSGGAEFEERNPNLYETILSGDLDANDVPVNDPCDLLNEPNRADNSYHVVTGSFTDETAMLDGFIIIGGNANGSQLSDDLIDQYKLQRGGGMYNHYGSPALNDCSFIDNSAKQGGGMYDYKGSPTLTNCTFTSNSAETGGGMYNWGSSPNLTNCTFNNNSAYYYSGMYNFFQSSPNLINCTFTDNSANKSGGGMGNTISNPILTNCTFSSNFAKNSSGGMSNSNSHPTLTNCTFSGNSAGAWGGGMSNFQSSPNLTNCMFSGNSAGETGGGMDNYDGSPTISNCMFSGNSAEHGGGLYNTALSNPILTNCTLSQNSAQNGNALACGLNYMSSPSNVELSNCILWNDGDEIWKNDGSTINITYSDVQDEDPNNVYPGTGNINANPCFAELGYWADANDLNVVVEPTDPNALWIEGDYHVKSTAGRYDPKTQAWIQDTVSSPCIDAGDPNSCLGFYEPYPNGFVINMGAYGGTSEASLSPSDINCITVDHPDYDEWIQVGEPICWCYSRQCHGDTDCKAQGKNNYWVSTEDLDILIAAWNKPFELLSGNQICADFDHKAQGKSKYRVSTDDLDILIANWNKANKPEPDCP
ncbi:MAG: hypothetical protein ACYS80_12260 [Planctomycetota bacterium]|jgi:hypothetical protein